MRFKERFQKWEQTSRLRGRWVFLIFVFSGMLLVGLPFLLMILGGRIGPQGQKFGFLGILIGPAVFIFAWTMYCVCTLGRECSKNASSDEEKEVKEEVKKTSKEGGGGGGYFTDYAKYRASQLKYDLTPTQSVSANTPTITTSIYDGSGAHSPSEPSSPFLDRDSVSIADSSVTCLEIREKLAKKYYYRVFDDDLGEYASFEPVRIHGSRQTSHNSNLGRGKVNNTPIVLPNNLHASVKTKGTLNDKPDGLHKGNTKETFHMLSTEWLAHIAK